MSSWNHSFKPLMASTLAVAISLATGCATVTTGSSQTLTVSTIPDGATCLMLRDGETVGAINGTPGSVTVDKDSDPINVECTLEGHQASSESVESKFQGATLGNVLIGGVIGIAIDAGSGAMNKYPSSVELILIPETFTSIEQRQEFLTAIDSKLSEYEASAIKKAEQSCGDDEYQCNQQREKARTEIEAKRKDWYAKVDAVAITEQVTMSTELEHGTPEVNTPQ